MQETRGQIWRKEPTEEGPDSCSRRRLEHSAQSDAVHLPTDSKDKNSSEDRGRPPGGPNASRGRAVIERSRIRVGSGFHPQSVAALAEGRHRGPAKGLREP